MGVTQLSMQADVSPNGVITEVRVRNTFTTAKTEFQHLSSERKAESTEEEGEDHEEQEDQEDQEDQEKQEELNDQEELDDQGEQEDMASIGEVIKEEPPEEKPLTGGECETYQGGSNGLEPPSTEPVKTEPERDGGDIRSTENNHSNHSNGTQHHKDQQTNSYQSNSSDQEEVSKNIPGLDESDLAACVKKPKLESQDYCDNNGGFDPLGKTNIFFIKMFLSNSDCQGDKNVLHSLMSQIDDVRPFPSPDHTYAISPAKDENESAEDDCDTPTYRKKVFKTS